MRSLCYISSEILRRREAAMKLQQLKDEKVEQLRFM
jgi:hypothetical protein